MFPQLFPGRTPTDLGFASHRGRAARHAAHLAATRTPRCTRNIALCTAEPADDPARAGRPDEPAQRGSSALDLLSEVRSSRIRSILATTARVLLPHRRNPSVAAFPDRHPARPPPA